MQTQSVKYTLFFYVNESKIQWEFCTFCVYDNNNQNILTQDKLQFTSQQITLKCPSHLPCPAAGFWLQFQRVSVWSCQIPRCCGSFFPDWLLPTDNNNLPSRTQQRMHALITHTPSQWFTLWLTGWACRYLRQWSLTCKTFVECEKSDTWQRYHFMTSCQPCCGRHLAGSNNWVPPK